MFIIRKKCFQIFLFLLYSLSVLGCSEIVTLRKPIQKKSPVQTIPLENIYAKPTKTIRVNSLSTIVPNRKREVIMRGILLPYEEDGIMHDSTFIYVVVQEAQWDVASSTKLKKKKVIGSIHGF